MRLSNGRDEVLYFSAQGRRFRSRTEVARFLGLSDPNSSSNTNKPGNNSSSSTTDVVKKTRNLMNTGIPRNNRDCENERKRLKREIDRLIKLHTKTSKSIDDLRNDYLNEKYPVNDNILMEEINQDQNASSNSSTTTKSCQQLQTGVVRAPDLCSFPSIPDYCTGDMLMVWDFLCTFNRILGLETISLEDFVSALTFQPSQDNSSSSPSNWNEPNTLHNPPVFLSEAHMSLLKLLVNDASSEQWWWSTLETDASGGEEVTTDTISPEFGGDVLTPNIKVDMEALLSNDEDPLVTKLWLQALDDVRTRKTNSGGTIKNSVKIALSITKNDIVKNYLHKAMRKWKGNAAGFTKRAVVWLVDKVREARPDLWGRKVSQEVIDAQTKKVVKEATEYMNLLEEDPDMKDDIDETNNTNSNNNMDESDDEDSDEDDEDSNNDPEDDELNLKSFDTAKRDKMDDNSTFVTSPIPLKPPPSLVDMLLPPQKIPFNLNELIYSPLAWPCIVGTAAGRIFHRYKKQRNNTDDDLREFWSLSPLTIAMRRKREENASLRVFSECATPINNDGEDPELPLESAVDHLSCGGVYLELSPVQRLCILRTLIEAAYDTREVSEAIEENFRLRGNAVKALENEQKKAKKDAREEAAAADKEARENLAREARETLINEKLEDIKRQSKYNSEYTSEFIQSLTDEDIINFDDEIKEAYAALPHPSSFNRSEVQDMVMKMSEEAALDADSVLVFTMDEIVAREQERLDELEKKLTFLKGKADSGDGEQEAVEKEVVQMKDFISSMKPIRAEAVQMLNDAIEAGTGKELKHAIQHGKTVAHLQGTNDEIDSDGISSGNGIWVLDLLRDAALEVKAAEKRRAVTEAQKDLIDKRNKCFIRTELFGKDRFRNNVWRFVYDTTERLWADTHYNIHEESFKQNPNKEQNQDGVMLHFDDPGNGIGLDSALISAADKEEDFLIMSSSENGRKLFCRQEHHPSRLISGICRRHWGSHSTETSLRSIMKNLNEKGIRDSTLKSNIKQMLESKFGTQIESTQKGDSNDAFKSSGDGDIFKEVLSSTTSLYITNYIEEKRRLESLASAIGQNVRVRQEVESSTFPGYARYEIGVVKSWAMIFVPVESSGEMQEQQQKLAPVWKIHLHKGHEIDLQSEELIQALIRYSLWRNGDKMSNEGNSRGMFIESDSSLFIYRNNMGRYCGRQADAAFATTVYSFAKQLVKKEGEMYNPLKNRSVYNNWGGKNMARNSWLAAMKDYENMSFNTVKDGLLRLEEAFFELAGRFDNLVVPDGSTDNVELPNGKELLNDENYRYDIELESITGTPKSLWNSRETRAIFIEIMQGEWSNFSSRIFLIILLLNSLEKLNNFPPSK